MKKSVYNVDKSCLDLPLQRSSQSRESPSRRGTVGSWWSDCELLSPWLELHTQHTCAHVRTHTYTQCPRYLIPSFTLCSKKRRNRNSKEPADEGLDALSSDWCHAHGHGLRGSEPVGVVITGCKVAHVVDIAEEEGHWTELPQTTACCT